ncbi:MAG: RNA repair domain-containing protein [Candidatus Hadarchaeales archaeon]
MKPRDVLNKLKWGGKNLSSIRVTIIHRGAEGNLMEIKGENIAELGRGFMRVKSSGGDVEIPYHRIVKIQSGEKLIWVRKRWSSS